mgnify:CR=1 FL=1
MSVISKKKELAGRIILGTTIVCTSYAVVRYNVAGDVPWKDLPVFIFNKGISLSSFVFLALCFCLGPLRNLGFRISGRLLESRKSLGLTGLIYSFAHFALSMSILNPVYFALFYEENGTLSLRGGFCLLGGVIGLVILWVYYNSFKVNAKKMCELLKIISSKRIIISIFFLIGIHLFFLGYSGWTSIDKWQAGLPPISLISFVICCTGFLINLAGRR